MRKTKLLKPRPTAACGVICVCLLAWLSVSAQNPPPPDAFDVEVHRTLGKESTGRPAVADVNNSGRVKLTVVDAKTGKPVFCRVNVVGADGDFYEPADNALAPWSLQRLGNRKQKGPFRYYGWFFYTNGECEVAVPPGKTRVEVWKGFEYGPLAKTVDVTKGKTDEVHVKITRAADMASRGWFSGDTHIHLSRDKPADDDRALDLAACEDLRYAHILCMNDPRFYKPVMDQQIWFQNRGLGSESDKHRGDYAISSGQEYRANTFGHICFVGGKRLVDADGLRTDPNNWPVFGVVADELHALGGYAFHAHGGYEKEIYADFAQNATDGVELLQFAVYRGIGLEGWYHILNAGFRFPAVGASDYPYCRALGDCRTYAYLGGGGKSFDDWNQAAAGGRSFFTTGPLLETTVNGERPGGTLDLPLGEHALSVEVRMTSPVAGVDEIHIVEGGRIVARRKLKDKERRGPVDWKPRINVDASTWVAVRAFAMSPSGREDVEAHTNPVYISLDGGRLIDRNSIEWLIKKLDERIAFHVKRDFKEKPKVLAYFGKSRRRLTELLEESVDR